MGISMWFSSNESSITEKILIFISIIALTGCNYFLSFMAASGATEDDVCDINMEGGLAEHVKDVIILTSASTVLATYSSYLWLLLFLAPGRMFQMLWSSVISPWIFSSDQPEVTEEEDE